MKTRILILVVTCLIITGIAFAADLPELNWYVFGGGGGPVSAGKYWMDGTIGQPIVGRVSGEKHELYAGYWVGVEGIFNPMDENIFLPLILH
jgi:hypothetical protein